MLQAVAAEPRKRQLRPVNRRPVNQTLYPSYGCGVVRLRPGGPVVVGCEVDQPGEVRTGEHAAGHPAKPTTSSRSSAARSSRRTARSPASAAEQPAEPKPAERRPPKPLCASRHQPEPKKAARTLRRVCSSLRNYRVSFLELIDDRCRFRDMLR
jgi:hypothetical protein